eukprot:2223349-Amphidinium_carterae.2
MWWDWISPGHMLVVDGWVKDHASKGIIIGGWQVVSSKDPSSLAYNPFGLGSERLFLDAMALLAEVVGHVQMPRAVHPPQDWVLGLASQALL